MDIKSALQLLDAHQCFNCGTLVYNANPFCKYCNHYLSGFKSRYTIHKNLPFNVKYLYYWPPAVSDALSAYFLGLKILKNKKTWQWVAQEWVNKWALDNKHTQNSLLRLSVFTQILIFPAPSSQGHTDDHASHWAQALSIWSGSDVSQIFIKQTATMQKNKSKQERRQIQIVGNENISRLREIKVGPLLCIFADDVLTTGETAKKGYELLKKYLKVPFVFEAWVVGYRGLKDNY
ncbi:MAG: hypothetical protein ACOYOK_12005 [Pseudobdellovibrionaceae bacterium]